MPTLNYNTVMTLVVDLVKTVADGGFPVVGPGELDPDAGETDVSASIAAFARVQRVTLRHMRRNQATDTDIAEVQVDVVIFCTDKGGDPRTAAAADINNVCGVLRNAVTASTAGGVRTEINLQLSGVNEEKPDAAIAARAIVVSAVGQAKAESV